MSNNISRIKAYEELLLRRKEARGEATKDNNLTALYLTKVLLVFYGDWRREWLDTYNAVLTGAVAKPDCDFDRVVQIAQDHANGLHGELPETPT